MIDLKGKISKKIHPVIITLTSISNSTSKQGITTLGIRSQLRSKLRQLNLSLLKDVELGAEGPTLADQPRQLNTLRPIR